MLFSVSGVECSPLVPAGAALIISFFTSMGGVSGAFLLLPFQMSFLGYAAPGVSATNHLFNVLACPGGILRYRREGRFLWPLARIVLWGSVPGAAIGALLRVWLLPDPSSFRIFAGLMLLGIGVRFALKLRKGGGGAVSGTPEILRDDSEELAFSFGGTEFRASSRRLRMLSLAVGLAGGVYGVGGGAVISPLLAALFGFPVHAIAGAVMLGTFGTSLCGVVSFLILDALGAPQAGPDWMLGLCLGLGGLCGSHLGARCQKFVPGRAIGWMLTGIMFFMSLRYLGIL